ncbi:hypothetical protein VMCG_04601 [Cytospora schulzeri]|uniref:ABM domain-containing protein n=1 Tax=Cytospora schulzeri TaxID=448051 RepID=A0A423WSG1_9PEZI|nr:hypothetical protein VMCG_04601 [Valsa malicola]
MAITEVAILQSSSSPLPASLKSIFTEDIKNINGWAASKPDLDFEGTWLFQQVEDPSVMMMTAKWKDKKAYEQWVVSEEHLRVLPTVIPHLAMKDGKSNGDMWFLEGDMFTSVSNKAEGVEVGLLNSPVVSFNRYFVAAEGKDALERRFNQVKGLLEDFAKPVSVRGAWRTDDEDGPRHAEWAVVVGWPSVEKHMDFAKQESFAKYRELLAFITGFEARHYRRFS